MILERSTHPSWLSNTYLVADREGGTGIFVDSGAPLEPLIALAKASDLTVSHLLVTHGHADHTSGNESLQRRFGLEIVTLPVEPFASGDLRIEALRTPGHSPDSLSFSVTGELCFTGDTLFAGSVGSSASDFADLRRSVMEVLLARPPETRLLPGHGGETTVAGELERNPFVRLWRGLDPEGQERCRVGGREAQLVLWADDYDGGFKAWVRFDDGRDAIVGGSRVERESHEG